MNEFRKSVYSTKIYNTNVQSGSQRREIDFGIFTRHKLVFFLILLTIIAAVIQVVFFGNPFIIQGSPSIIERPAI